MSNPFAMDQSEKVGLGTAVGGHALLLALLVFGLWKAAVPMGSDGGGSGDGIAVEIVTEGAAAAPDPAPSVVEEIEEALVAIDETVVDPDPVATPVQKLQPKPDQLVKPKIKSQPKPVQKTVKTGTGRGGGKSDFEKEMEKKLGGIGGGVGSNKTKGPGEGSGQGASTKTAGEIRKAADVAIASEVRPLIPGCAPSTSDNSSLFVFVQLNIGQKANLISANVYDVRGITPGNQAQVEQMKRCVLDSLRKASPYNLDTEQYDTWRNHKVQLKVNFK
jgi:periplasmic protein TonB